MKRFLLFGSAIAIYLSACGSTPPGGSTPVPVSQGGSSGRSLGASATPVQIGSTAAPSHSGAPGSPAMYLLRPSDLPAQMTRQTASVPLSDPLLSCRNVPFTQTTSPVSAGVASYKSAPGPGYRQVMSVAVVFSNAQDAQGYLKFTKDCYAALRVGMVPLPSTVGDESLGFSSPQGGYPAVGILWRQAAIVDLVLEATAPPPPAVGDVYILAATQSSYAPH